MHSLQPKNCVNWSEKLFLPESIKFIKSQLKYWWYTHEKKNVDSPACIRVHAVNVCKWWTRYAVRNYTKCKEKIFVGQITWSVKANIWEGYCIAPTGVYIFSPICLLYKCRYFKLNMSQYQLQSQNVHNNIIYLLVQCIIMPLNHLI